ncbi:MAG: aa3-type cytochrome c oxidase subunit IV [Sneathiella sp.]|nr:MAG: aa3-type cytochrome c oxidase subunit IV [Sneathiella sp.]
MSEHGNMNIDTQKETFQGFVKLFTYGTIAIVILLVLMATFLT